MRLLGRTSGFASRGGKQAYAIFKKTATSARYFSFSASAGDMSSGLISFDDPHELSGGVRGLLGNPLGFVAASFPETGRPVPGAKWGSDAECSRPPPPPDVNSASSRAAKYSPSATRRSSISSTQRFARPVHSLDGMRRFVASRCLPTRECSSTTSLKRLKAQPVVALR
jgi:hypothetical protein